jgi:hypothetical protein
MTDIELSDAILAQLQKGKNHAITGKIMAQRLNLKSTRSIRLTIVEMRHAGIPIIGGQTGYFIAENIGEILEAKEYLRSYIIDLAHDLRDYKRIAQKFAGQLSLKL